MPDLDLATLLALECHLARDQMASAELRQASDHDLLRACEHLPPRRTLLLNWLRRVDALDRLEARWRTRLQVSASTVLLLAFAVGAGSCMAVLTPRPADLFLCIGLLLGVPLVLLQLVLLALLRGSAGGLGSLLLQQLQRWPALRRWSADKGIDAPLQRLQLYATEQRLAMLALTQRAAVAGLCGMLLAFAVRVTFSELRFSWATSLPVMEQAQRIHGIGQMLAAPGARFWPEANPDFELVLASRLGSEAPRGSAGWWPFLLMLLLVYGLLPRVLLASWLHLRLRRRLHLWDGSDARSLALDARLRARYQGWQKAQGSSDHLAGSMSPTMPVTASLEHAELLAWNDIPISRDEAMRLLPPGLVAEIGTLHQQPQDLPGNCPAVVVLAESWEAPSKAVRHMLTALRQQLQQAPIVVLLLDGSEQAWTAPQQQDLELWRRRLGELNDPHLHVEGVSGE